MEEIIKFSRRSFNIRRPLPFIITMDADMQLFFLQCLKPRGYGVNVTKYGDDLLNIMYWRGCKVDNIILTRVKV